MKKDIERITAYRKMKAMGVSTINQAVVLLAINYQDDIMTVDLAKVIGTTRGSTSELCKQLRAKGLIGWTQRQVSKRNNTRHYHLTPKGKDAVEFGRQA